MNEILQRPKERSQELKKGLELREARNKRWQHAVAIRKSVRHESLKKKRITAEIESISDRSKALSKLVSQIQSNDRAKQLAATTQLRKLLSIEHNPPIQDVVDAKIVPKFISFLRASDAPLLQFEAAWALTNIASGSSAQTQLVIEAGAIPILNDLLISPNIEVREQAIWALGNIAGDSPQCRDVVVAAKIVDNLLKNLNESPRISLLRNATWTLSNLCRGKPSPKWSLVSSALPILCTLVQSTDDEVLMDACWALSYLSDGPNERIQAVINSGIHKQLVPLLLHKLSSVQTPALRAVGNIVTGDNFQTQIMVSAGVLPPLLKLLKSSNKGIRKEACWTISNITAGNKEQIGACIEAQIMPHLVELLKSSDFDVKKEAAWAISNATSGGTPEQIRYLVDLQVIGPLCDLLSCSDLKIVMATLEGLENILKIGEKDAALTGINAYSALIEQCGGIDLLEELQNHQKYEIYAKSVRILELYFCAEEEDESSAPNSLPSGGAIFQFGAKNVQPQAFVR